MNGKGMDKITEQERKGQTITGEMRCPSHAAQKHKKKRKRVTDSKAVQLQVQVLKVGRLQAACS